MIKVDHTILPNNVVGIAFETNKESDLRALDLILEAFGRMPGVTAGFKHSSRLILHISGVAFDAIKRYQEPISHESGVSSEPSPFVKSLLSAEPSGSIGPDAKT